MLLSKNAVGCADCAFRLDCGGIFDKPSIFGCYSECIANCNPEVCDLTCPNNQRLFSARFAEIEGDFRFSAPPLNVPALTLPRYVPKIHNGSGRLQPLFVPVAAIPARALLQKSGSDISCRFKNPAQVREYFCLSKRTAYIISCVSTDDEVEMVWESLIYGQLAEEWARLKPAAVIVPNFSFFIDDVPRTHTIYNRKRICLAARILSEAGCHVILPLSALTPNDWDFWYQLLQENPAMKYVAKEFQTGLCGPKAGVRAINHLAKLQERLGRPLHPVALGGGRYKNNINIGFDNHTILESRAFILMTQRVRATQNKSGSYSEVSSPTVLGEPTDNLLRHNIKARMDRLK